MAERIDARRPDFEARFLGLLERKREAAADVDGAVAAILDDVRHRGDDAIFEYTHKFDGLSLTAATVRVSATEIDVAVAKVGVAERDALATAARRIEDYHRRQIPTDQRYTDASGVVLGFRWTAIAAVGLYVPGGKAAYPSSVLMNAIPARVAGVERMAMVVPSPGGVLNPLVLAAARTAGITEVYRVGGAQAVGALAFGTKSIAAVDKIVGPGNAYVAAAKRRVFGTVGIDMIAGPSEVLVYADGSNEPDWIAADLLSQAEHDETAQSILVTEDEAFAGRVEVAVDRTLATLARKDIAGASWRDFGAVIVVKDRDQAIAVIDRVAAEHLELAVADPEAVAARVRNAGAIFLGRHTPEAIGDYVAGPSHVLPTARSVRFSSGLSVLDFLKRTSLIGCSPDSVRAIGPDAAILADAEGLGAHALSVRLRLGKPLRG